MRTRSVALVVTAAVALAIGARPAVAQPAPTDSADFETQQFHAAIMRGGYFAADGIAPLPRYGLRFGVFGNYGHEPLVLAGNGLRSAMIRHQLAFDVTASVALARHVELGVLLPFAAYQRTDNVLAKIPGAGTDEGAGTRHS